MATKKRADSPFVKAEDVESLLTPDGTSGELLAMPDRMPPHYPIEVCDGCASWDVTQTAEVDVNDHVEGPDGRRYYIVANWDDYRCCNDDCDCDATTTTTIDTANEYIEFWRDTQPEDEDDE